MATNQTAKTKVTQSPPVRKAKRGNANQSIPQAYLDLMERFLLQPIRTDRDLARATILADDLASRQESLLPEEQDYFDVLCGLIERYETESVAMPDVGAVEVLRFLIDQAGVSTDTVATETGIANATLTALIKGSRPLNAGQVEKLAAFFHVEPAVFLPGNE